MELSDLQFAVVQQNKINELEEDLCNIQLLIDNPLCKIRERDNEPTLYYGIYIQDAKGAQRTKRV